MIVVTRVHSFLYFLSAVLSSGTQASKLLKTFSRFRLGKKPPLLLSKVCSSEIYEPCTTHAAVHSIILPYYGSTSGICPQRGGKLYRTRHQLYRSRFFANRCSLESPRQDLRDPIRAQASSSSRRPSCSSSSCTRWRSSAFSIVCTDRGLKLGCSLQAFLS